MHKVANHLDIDISDLPVSFQEKPGGRSSWWGVFLSDCPKGNCSIELSTELKKNAFGKKVIIHELLHYLMHPLDAHIQCKVIPQLSTKGKRNYADSTFKKNREKLVNHLTEVIYREIEHGTKKSKG